MLQNKSPHLVLTGPEALTALLAQMTELWQNGSEILLLTLPGQAARIGPLLGLCDQSAAKMRLIAAYPNLDDVPTALKANAEIRKEQTK